MAEHLSNRAHISSFNRYVWLLDLISRNNGISHKNISNEWEKSPLNEYPGSRLPKRTLHNHIKAIYDMFHIEIVCLKQAGYPYVLKESDNSNLSVQQQSLLTHLRITNAMTNNSDKLRGRVIMNQYDKFRWFTPLVEAIQTGVAIEITYFADEGDRRIHSNAERIVVEPYFINQFDNWFMVGRVVRHTTRYDASAQEADGELHAFEFKSIRNIELTEEAFETPKDFDPMSYITDPPYIPAGNVPNDDDMFLAERASGITRSRWGNPYTPAEGEVDFRRQEFANEERAIEFKRQIRYRKIHSRPIDIATTGEFEDLIISIQNYDPSSEPYIRVSTFEPFMHMKTTLKDGVCTMYYCSPEESESKQKEHFAQTSEKVRKWLDAPCSENRFNGTNREYVLWLWKLLGM